MPHGAGAPVVLAVYSGSGLADLQPLGAARAFTSVDGALPRVAWEASAGSQYWIAVAFEAQPGSGWHVSPFPLRLREAPLPGNDAFAAARTVRVPGVYTGSLLDASAELGEPRVNGVVPPHSLWFRFRARSSARMTVDVGSFVRAVRDPDAASAGVAVYRGSSLSHLRPVAAPRDLSVVRFSARRGERYFVQVFANGLGNGDFTLDISDGSIEGKGVTLEVVGGQTIRTVRARGLRVLAGARRRTTVELSLRVPSRVARGLGLKSTVLGRARGRLDYVQRLAADIPLTREAERALRGLDSLALVVRVQLLSKAPRRTLDVPVRLPN